MIIALPAAGLHCSFLEAPFPLPTLASLLQLRHSWHGSRMLLLHRGNCSNSWKSSVSILVVAWLEIIRSWWMALLKLMQGIAEHCPALWGAPCRCCKAVLDKMFRSNQSLSQAELLGADAPRVTPLLSAALGSRESPAWSLMKHNLCDSHSKGFSVLSQKGEMGAQPKFLDLDLWRSVTQKGSSQPFCVGQSDEWDLHLLLVLFLQN